jgi:hypothetical protein
MDFEAVPILAIIFGFVAFCVYMDYRVKLVKARASSNGDELEAINRRLEEKTSSLEKRIRVLESIVTDKQHRLREEIESL